MGNHGATQSLKSLRIASANSVDSHSRRTYDPKTTIGKVDIAQVADFVRNQRVGAEICGGRGQGLLKGKSLSFGYVRLKIGRVCGRLS